MKKLKKILKHMLLYIGLLIAILIITYLAFVNLYPSFGAEKLDKITLKEDILLCETCKTTYK